ncbi:hypothetical protein HK405_011922, partial [Cladochytrium tenue]
MQLQPDLGGGYGCFHLRPARTARHVWAVLLAIMVPKEIGERVLGKVEGKRLLEYCR